MQLVLGEDQELLAKTVSDFARERCAVARLRAFRDTKDPTGFSRELWKEMAALGWVGMLLPETLGGAGMGLAELAVVLEGLGRTLTPEPFLGTVLLGGEALRLGGSEETQREWLPGVAEGERILTLAWQESGSRDELHRVGTRAERAGDGFVLSGEKIQVLDGHVADGIVVAARTAGGEADAAGITLFLVPRGTRGLDLVRQFRVDSRNAAVVRLDRVRLPATAVIGAKEGGAALLEEVVDRASVGLSAEMLGAMTEAFERTLAYLKTRMQFGVAIGSFQALKHRAAEMFIQIELARSAVMAAARATDAGEPEAKLLVSLCKARCSDAFLLVANEAIQMHGGIGMTDEHEIGFFLKRARVAEFTFGDAAFHRDRWARLKGY